METRIPAVGVTERRARWRRTALALCAASPAVWFPCPPAYPESNAVIWEGNDQSVVLAPQDDETAPPNDHPATVAARDVERMLAGLSLKHADQGTDVPPVPLFNAEQIEILGEALVTGLSRATPSQDVTFSIIGAHRLSPDAFVRRNRLTAGRAFVREGKLNVIFGELQSPYRKKNIYGRIEQDFSPREYGSRTTPAEQESILIAGTASRLREGTDGLRHDWVVFDPDTQGAPGSSFNIEQRLRTLKHLREKGLVSEEAYRRKVDEILQEL